MPDDPLDLRCICIEVRNAAQALTRLYDEQLLDAGISITQLSQLNHIHKLGAPTLKALAEATGLDRSTLGRNMRLLEKQGLVVLSSGEDARTRIISLTRDGKAALRHAAPLWLDMQHTLNARLGPRKRALLSELLSELTTQPGSSP
ncbi:MAG: MarR family winged helix-turn-helix transcriptional regulator [Pseudomonadota bacterium]